MPAGNPQAYLPALLENMSPEMMRTIRQAQAGATSMPGIEESPGDPGADEAAKSQARRDRIKDAMMQAREGFEQGLAATPQTGPQSATAAPPAPSQPGSVQGASVGGMTQGPFPQRVTPEMAQMQGGAGPFPMSPGFRGGFPRFGA